MSSVIDLLNQEPPSRLYHYTTAAGLLGIVGNKQIWASHTQYLNDHREFKHAIKVIETEIARMKDEPEFASHKKVLERMPRVLKNCENANVCVCSFSSSGDVLSQWRAYGGVGGFSIAFGGHFLKNSANAQGFWLAKCIYDEAEQRSTMRKLVTDVLQEQAGLGGANAPGGNLATYIRRYAPLLKDKSFIEEQEWRIISRPFADDELGFEFRSGASMLIPYYKVALSSETMTFDLEKIIVGPTPNSRQSRRSVQKLMKRQGLEKAEVENTKVPFRSW